MSILDANALHKWLTRVELAINFDFAAYLAHSKIRHAIGLYMLALCFAGKNGGSLRGFEPDRAAGILGIGAAEAQRIMEELDGKGLLDGQRVARWRDIADAGVIEGYVKPLDASERVRRMRSRRREEAERALARFSPGAGGPAEGRGERGVSAEIVPAPAGRKGRGKSAGLAAMAQVTAAEIDATVAAYSAARNRIFNLSAWEPDSREMEKMFTLPLEELNEAQRRKLARLQAAAEEARNHARSRLKAANEALRHVTLQGEAGETLHGETARQTPAMPASAYSGAASRAGQAAAVKPEIVTLQAETLQSPYYKESRARVKDFNINKLNININKIFNKRERQPGGGAAVAGQALGSRGGAPQQSAALQARNSQAQAAPGQQAGDGAYLMAPDGRRLAGASLAAFEKFWRAFALPRNKSKAVAAWLDIVDLTPALAGHIIDAAGQEASGRERIEARGGIPVQAPNWLINRRWEDYERRTEKRAQPVEYIRLDAAQIERNWNAQAVRYAQWLTRNRRPLPAELVARLAAQGLTPAQIGA